MSGSLPAEIQRRLADVAVRQGISEGDLLAQVLSNALDEVESAAAQPAALESRLLFSDEETMDAEPASIESGLPFSFIDLFAGIGGLRLGLEAVGGRCVFSCEKDAFACRTYQSWFGENPSGDVTELASSGNVPDHDLLAAGFPCQPFSIAGVSKKNSLGRAHGFRDKTQGTLFFHLAEIIDQKQPPVLLLENVKNLRAHDSGRTWNTIEGTLQELGYRVFARIIDAADYVPQHRERIFIVGFRTDVFGDDPAFQFPDRPAGRAPRLKDILNRNVDDRYTLSDKLWNYLQDYAEKHRRRGNGFGCSVASLNGVTRTLSARYYKDGSEILIPQTGGKNPRRLTPQEAGRLMGFPEHLTSPEACVVSDTQAYRQFGNAVVPAVVTAVARQIVAVMRDVVIGRSQNGCLLKPVQTATASGKAAEVRQKLARAKPR
ncbi:MAG: DNA (cytosine-5-)-methyltransferase [Planctomycetaceae bacterium]|nr:DNA (cytosine-5-)-methyltransferase [Planctomycetaceae bacterium]